MLLKFFRHGTGDGSKAMDYLLKNSADEPKQVIRGDSGLTLDIIQSVPFKQKYKSGVLSFEESEIDPNIAEAIMEGFEQTIFCGIEDDCNILWVEHRDKGRMELHFIIPRIHLGTGKAFNPYWHKVDLKRVDTFKELVNLQYGLSDPNDPEKNRTHSYEYNPHDKRLADVPKDELAEVIYEMAAEGVIKNRGEMIEQLLSAGYSIPRVGNSYISVKSDDMKKAKRMKGGIFDASFTSLAALEREARERVESYKRDRNNSEARVAKLEQELERLNDKKALYYAKRYQEDQLSSNSDVVDRDARRRWSDVVISSDPQKGTGSIPDNSKGAVDEAEQYIDQNTRAAGGKRTRGERSVSAKTRRDRTSRFEEFRASRRSLYEQTFADRKRLRERTFDDADRGLKQASTWLEETARKIDDAAQIIDDIIEKRQKGRDGGSVGGGTR